MRAWQPVLLWEDDRSVWVRSGERGEEGRMLITDSALHCFPILRNNYGVVRRHVWLMNCLEGEKHTRFFSNTPGAIYLLSVLHSATHILTHVSHDELNIAVVFNPTLYSCEWDLSGLKTGLIVAEDPRGVFLSLFIFSRKKQNGMSIGCVGEAAGEARRELGKKGGRGRERGSEGVR